MTDEPPVEVTIDELVRQFIAMRKARDAKEEAHTLAMKPANDWLFKQNGLLLGKLKAMGVDSAKTPHGTVYQKTTKSATISDGIIYVPCANGALYALTDLGTTGVLYWPFPFRSQRTGISSPVVGNDGTIYVGSTDHRLHALFPDGARKTNQLLDDLRGGNGTIRVPCECLFQRLAERARLHKVYSFADTDLVIE